MFIFFSLSKSYPFETLALSLVDDDRAEDIVALKRCGSEP